MDKIYVWGRTKKIAEGKLHDLINNDNDDRDFFYRRSDYVEFDDGTTVRAVTANESSKGNKCDFAFVDSDISKEILDTIIIPCIRPLEYIKIEELIEFF